VCGRRRCHAGCHGDPTTPAAALLQSPGGHVICGGHVMSLLCLCLWRGHLLSLVWKFWIKFKRQSGRGRKVRRKAKGRERFMQFFLSGKIIAFPAVINDYFTQLGGLHLRVHFE